MENLTLTDHFQINCGLMQQGFRRNSVGIPGIGDRMEGFPAITRGGKALGRAE